MGIDVKTLHIGSHVSMNGVRARVVRLTTVDYGHGDRWHILVRCISPDDGIEREVGRFVDDDAVQPISITPALLEELGFEHRFEHIHKHWWKGAFHIHHVYGSVYFDFGEYQEIRIQYLHELESLYYMIYETELIPD